MPILREIVFYETNLFFAMVNDSTNLYNTRIQSFPELVLAKHFGFKDAKLLEFSEEEKKDVDVKSLFA